MKYTEPIYLPQGKVSVRALAVSSDGRESAVVTKLFLVEYVPTDSPVFTEDNEDNFLKEYARDIARQETLEGGSPLLNLMTSVGNAWGDTSQRLQALQIQGGDSHWVSKGPRFLTSRLGPLSPSPASPCTLAQTGIQGDAMKKSLTSTQISRIQRETDFLRCAHCLSDRPSDPFARFCLQCGAPVPPIPGQRLPPTEGAQMGLCVHCKSMVPVNTPSCVVCEAPLGPQLQPQASLRLKDKVICQSCGTGNPAHITYCVTCETRLPEPSTAVLSGQSAPPLPSLDGKMISCSKCSRVNVSDARFCDWCGAKPGPPAAYLTCSRCGASSHPYANYCGSCGVFLEGPQRPDSNASATLSAGGTTEPDHLPSFRADSATWQPAPPSLPPALAASLATPCMDQQTQTVGLFYPSGAEIQKKNQQMALELARQEQMRDRKPLLTAISPGKGYWRKQLDHICAHLRSYAQNNPEFRALIGEPRMGKMISAFVQEDSFEVSLRINFVSAASERPKVAETRKLVGRLEQQLLSSVMEGNNSLSGSQTSLVSENSVVSGTPRKNRRNQRTNRAKEGEMQLPSKDAELLEEVGPQGKGRISVVQQLLEEGADPSCRSSDGRPALTVAVLNLHHEVIPLLVTKGANIDQQSGPVNNSALHEAAAQGIKALQCAETLLGCNASIRRKNDRGQTVYDLAVLSGCSPLVSLLAAKTGQNMLDKMTKPRNISLDTF
ncbi:hypothetical protein JZ751_003610 [Albula glossodonta]|uniref:DZANK-type domain-containing protein n=1 Tax=Albula glossodonta TaxID=121402 RepID=A0A8T2N6D1_9TELE|nr:hypothetical protein JZ751_003610 [Albula glossodonta]